MLARIIWISARSTVLRLRLQTQTLQPSEQGFSYSKKHRTACALRRLLRISKIAGVYALYLHPQWSR